MLKYICKLYTSITSLNTLPLVIVKLITVDLRRVVKMLKGQIYHQTDSPVTISYYKF